MIWGADEADATHLGGYACGAEEARVLVHVERDAAHVVGLEHARAEVMDEAQRRDDERRGPGELLSAIGRGVVSAFQCGEMRIGFRKWVTEGRRGHMSEKERAHSLEDEERVECEDDWIGV